MAILAKQQKASEFGEAMLMAEENFRKEYSWLDEPSLDLWKDLRRAFGGIEFYQEVIKRCELWGVDCSAVELPPYCFDCKLLTEDCECSSTD